MSAREIQNLLLTTAHALRTMVYILVIFAALADIPDWKAGVIVGGSMLVIAILTFYIHIKELPNDRRS